MTARYGLPDHLIEPTAYAVRVAWEASKDRDPDWAEEFEGRSVYTLTALWTVRVDNQIHADLLSPQYARELLRVVQDGIAINGNWLQSPMAVCFESAFPSALDLDLKAEEILMTLQDIASTASVAA
jgi:hypothetical protein